MTPYKRPDSACHASGKKNFSWIRIARPAGFGYALAREAMHEASIMESVLETAAAEAGKAGAVRILRIRLRVGILSGVVPEALEFAFEGLKDGTPAAGATLEIERAPAFFRCLDCQARPELFEMAFTCPACGGALVVDSGGSQLELTQLELN